MTTTQSAALVPTVPLFTSTERLALAGSLPGYSGLTREAHKLDLRQYASWCHRRHLRLFQARRADIECFARDLESRGRARATITRRLCTVAGFYWYAVEEDLLVHSPAAHVRRPRVWTMSGTPPGWTATNWVRCWSPPGWARPDERALISLLALNGLRVSEATGADIEALGVERWAPHLGGHSQGRQGGHRPACAAYRAGDRPGLSASAARDRSSCRQSTPANTGSRSWRQFSRPASAPASAHSAR